MKKIFFAAGILAFSFASAQQNDFFDIQKYLKKKNELNKKLTVDNLFILPKNRCWKSPNLPFFKKDLQLLTTRTKTKILTELTNGNKAYSLPQDNMPCIVPDMSQFNMPNIANPKEYFQSLADRTHKPGKMPNAIIPYRIIPE